MARKKKTGNPSSETQTRASGKAAAAGEEGVGSKIAQMREFFEESKVELKKVTWPTKKETMATSAAVLLVVFVMAIFLGVIDMALSKIVTLILS